MAEELENGTMVPQPADVIDMSGVAAMRALGESVDEELGLRPKTEQAGATGNLNSVFTPGDLRFGASVISGWANIPPELTGPFILTTHTYPDLNRWGWQEAVMHGSASVRMWRHTQTLGVWGPWRVLGSGGGGPSDIPTNALALGSRAMRLQMFCDAYPLVSTGDRGAVVFRYDHGLTNFKGTLKPLHDQYNIPAYIAMNSRNWELPENSGATQAEAAAWDDVEWGNHTADHNDKIGIADIHDTIAVGRAELEAQVGATVHGFSVPGLGDIPGGTKFDGFGTGGASGYSDSYAGALILSHHAIASGTITEPGAAATAHRRLDGELRLGGRHYTWESAEWASIKAQIDSAIANKVAITLMCHPRTMGLSGYWTAALAEQVISYVREQIDAGNLADISYYQSHRAQLDPLEAATIDTGWRDMSNNLEYGWTGGNIFIRRIGDEVAAVFKGLDGTNATNAAVIKLDPGFGPDTFTGGSQAFYARSQVPVDPDDPTGPTRDAWGSAGGGFLRLALTTPPFISRTGTWASIRFPAEATRPNMNALPGTPRV